MTKGDKIKLRAELAGKAMQGMLVNTDEKDMRLHARGELSSIIEKNSIEFADGLMKELGLADD